jgi:D-psicose/D-tagatose/L-ribulose 3-epimerase
MRLGAHLCLWQTRWDEDVLPHLRRAAEIGYEGVEISLFSLRGREPAAVRREAERCGVAVTCSTGLSPDADIAHADPGVRSAGEAALRRDLETAAAAGAGLLCGVTYAAWGALYRGAEKTGALQRSAEALARAGDAARSLGLRIAVEALNRHETSLINTAAEGRAFVEAVGHPHVGLHLDTHHLSSEENDVADAIRTDGKDMFHFHVGENDRGVPSTGTVPWVRVAAALREIRYAGWVTLECVTVPGTEVADGFRVWRPMGPAPDEAAASALAFLRATLGPARSGDHRRG